MNGSSWGVIVPNFSHLVLNSLKKGTANAKTGFFLPDKLFWILCGTWATVAFIQRVLEIRSGIISYAQDDFKIGKNIPLFGSMPVLGEVTQMGLT